MRPMTNFEGQAHIRIECRSCFGDGWHGNGWMIGYPSRHKVQCSACEGRGYLWVHPSERKPTDELFKGKGR